MDIVTANGIATGSHGVSILLSNGDGTFQPSRNFVTNTDPTAVAVGDFNRDGKLDVAAINPADNSVSILFGNGDGTLRPPTTLVLPGTPHSLAVSDLNGDANPDLVVGLQMSVSSTAAGILLNHGDGTFWLSTIPDAPQILVGDFNGDGKPDLVVFGLLTSPFAVTKLGNGDGTFTDSLLPFSVYPFQPSYGVVGDFNGDGKLDIYAEFVGRGSRSGFVQGSYMVIGNGDGTFTVNFSGLINVGIGGQNLIAGDFNGDGKLDVAGVLPAPLAAGQIAAPTLKIMYGKGDGTLSFPLSFPAGNLDASFVEQTIVSADFDGNGAPDFAWPNGSGMNVIRNAQGNPPLLSGLSVNGSFVVGGAAPVSGTVTVGGPAPAAGAVVSVNSSDAAKVHFPGGGAVTIPAGSTPATFAIATVPVAVQEQITIGASWNGVAQSTSFNLIPAFSVSSVGLVASKLFGLVGGLNSSSATVSLTGPASDGVVVDLVSSNPALVAVPASVAFTPGSVTAPFTVRLLTTVPVDTVVTISATFQGIRANAALTVLAATDKVTITKSEYVVRTGVWTIEATDTNLANARIDVLTPAGVDFGVLFNQGGGKFKGQGAFSPSLTSVVLQSPTGGTATGAVSQK